MGSPHVSDTPRINRAYSRTMLKLQRRLPSIWRGQGRLITCTISNWHISHPCPGRGQICRCNMRVPITHILQDKTIINQSLRLQACSFSIYDPLIFSSRFLLGCWHATRPKDLSYCFLNRSRCSRHYLYLGYPQFFLQARLVQDSEGNIMSVWFAFALFRPT